MQNPEIVNNKVKKSLFGDISNTVEKKDISMKSDQSALPSPTLSSEPSITVMNDGGNSINDFQELRELIDGVLFKNICSQIHHAKASFDVDELVEEIEDTLESEPISVNETVIARHHGKTIKAQVLSGEKRGGAKLYTIQCDGVKLDEKFNNSSLKRMFLPEKEHIEMIIKEVANKEQGKVWEIKQQYKDELAIKDKLASIFCSPKPKNDPKVLTARKEGNGGDSSEDDQPLENIRRSGAGLHPTATNKDVEKKRKQKEKKEKKKEENEKKNKDKENMNGGAINKFLQLGTPSKVANSPATGSPFLTPQKRSEKRFNSATQKLNDAWKKRDQKDFGAAATWAAKVLSGVQIDKLENELHRYSVRKIFDKEKDKEQMKKMNKEQKSAYKEKVAGIRKSDVKLYEPKIRSYFNEKVFVEDLSVDSSNLPLFGERVNVSDEKMSLFSDCLMVTQFISSLRKFIGHDEHISAASLLDSIGGNRIDYMNCTSKVLLPLVKTLVEDQEYKKHAHINARLFELPVEATTVSEMCRALLVGKTEVSFKNDKRLAEEEKPALTDAVVNENNTGDDHEGGADDSPFAQLDFTIIEKEECDDLLEKFSADKEFWQLDVHDQMMVLRMLMNRICDLESFKDYMKQEGLSDEARSLKNRIDKIKSDLDNWREKLTDLPDPEEDVDMSALSRQQSRERSEGLRKRENLEKKLADNEDKLEELLEKLAHEKHVQALAKRIVPIGQDRHFRYYYFFPKHSTDRGLWIQDLGMTPYETFVRKCVTEGKSIETPDEGVDGASHEEIPSVSNIKETWYHINDVANVEQLMSSLIKIGSREGELKEYLKKNMDLVQLCIGMGTKKENSMTPKDNEDDNDVERSESHSRSVSVEPSTMESSDPLDSLKLRVESLYTDLRECYLTSLDPSFEAELVSCDTLQQMRAFISQLVSSIHSSAIIVKYHTTVQQEKGWWSHFVIDRFKARVSEARNSSALHLLVMFLDSRIDWKKSIIDKRCTVCKSQRSKEAKIGCSSCDVVLHYYCAKPKLHEKPSVWTCQSCTRVEQKRKREQELKRQQEESEKENEKSDDSEEDEEEKQENEDDDDDYYKSSRPTRAAARKRVMFDSDMEDDADQEDGARHLRTRAKKSKTSNNPDLGECDEIMSKLKATRVYKSLQAIPSTNTRSTRRGTKTPAVRSIDEIDSDISEYDSLNDFTSDLQTFLNAALFHFQENIPRKVSEVEELIETLKEHLSN